jgi:short-subunit dehydrogenase
MAGEKAGAIDLLVNNAGIAILEPFLETKVENFQKTMEVNVRQVFQISQIIAKGMVQRGKGGAIVNISSQVGEKIKRK